MYKLIGKDGKEYLSEQTGQFGGHRKMKIYGRLDCPSALRHIAAGQYVPHRVFFADEATALSAGYRPCGVCMKEHYNLWKGGRLMTHALEIVPVLNESAVCSVRQANGETRSLTADKLRDTPIPDELGEGIENCRMKIEGDTCVIILTSHSGQWGYTMVWDYGQDRLLHLTNTPFAVAAAVVGSQIATMYLVQYWGHPADLWYSIEPLELTDSKHEPEKIPLTISPDDSSQYEICQKAGKLFFRAGKQEQCVDKFLDN